MVELCLATVVFLLAMLLAGMFRILRGPSDADRMMAAQLFGTQATAILLLIAIVFDVPAIVDVALVLALLAAVATIAFVSHKPGEESIDVDR
jgi:multicomponent Na+:H+ antiporter subunit F